MRKNQNQVEWRDTNNKPYYVTYNFPISITNRCWFFYANVQAGLRKTLNLANALAVGNKLSIVFLYGSLKANALENYIEKLDNRQLIVLQAEYISADDIKHIDEVCDWLKGIEKCGYRAKDENKNYIFGLTDIFRKYAIDKVLLEKAREFDDAKDRIIPQTQDDITSNGYKVLWIKGIDRVSGQADMLQDDLLKIIKTLYPCGIETDTENEFAYKRVAVPKLIELGLQGDTENTFVKNCGVKIQKDHGLIQMSLFDDYSPSATRIVGLIREIYKQDMKRLGYVNTQALCDVLTNRPYGLYECNYYYYLLAFALGEFTKGYYYCWLSWSGAQSVSQRTDDVVFNRFNIFLPLIYVQTDKQKSLIRKLCKLFDIKDEPITVSGALNRARGWAMDNIRYDTIDRISPELFDLLRGDDIKDYSLETERLDDYLDEQTMERLYRQLRTIDNDCFDRIAKQYGTEAAERYKSVHQAKGCIIGWCWKKDFVDDNIKAYIERKALWEVREK